RAFEASDQHDEAIKTAEQVLQLSKNHAGARTLLAMARWKKSRKDPKAIELLQEVTKKGPVQEAASRYELVDAYSLLGDIYLSQSKMTAAEKAFNSALKLDPKSERALVGNGELFYQAGRYAEALGRFKAAFQVNPKNVHAAVGRAKSKLALEQAKEAKTELLAFAKTSKHPLVGYWLGQAHLALGERDEAEKAYRAAIKNNPTHPDVVYPYVALADLLDARNKRAEAEEILAEATEKLPKSAALYNAKGDVALKAGRIEEAKREFNKALEIEPDNSASRFRLGVAHRRAGEYELAAKRFDEVSAADPEFPGLALERGLLFEDTGNTEQALKMYADALQKAPDDIDLKLRVASTQVISGHPEKALPLLKQIIAKRPRSAEVNHFLGRAKLLVGESPQDALRYLETAVRSDPNQAAYHLYVAWAANESGQPGVAQDAIEKALEIDKNLGDAYWQKGVLLQKQGRTLDALEELEIALQKNPTRYEAYATMARCYVDQSNLAKAEEAWRKAIEGNKWRPEWQFRLGKILMDRGAKDEAAPFLRRAVDLLEERKQTPAWLWNANWLLGEALRNSDPKRALKAYKEFLRLSTSENAYRPDAEKAVEELEERP
ncbi:MAG TPA: tetratricopeptide repeat protein, partial [Polyangiaceae bacterium]|nr:tetratricopeptide repeat protein [Polyangiaceae bacterium]